MKQLFATEHDAIKWVGMNIAFAVKPKNYTKAQFVYPFVSNYAHTQVVEHLGKQLFKHQQEMNYSEIPNN
jgi:hypothetical protein